MSHLVGYVDLRESSSAVRTTAISGGCCRTDAGGSTRGGGVVHDRRPWNRTITTVSRTFPDGESRAEDCKKHEPVAEGRRDRGADVAISPRLFCGNCFFRFFFFCSSWADVRLFFFLLRDAVTSRSRSRFVRFRGSARARRCRGTACGTWLTTASVAVVGTRPATRAVPRPRRTLRDGARRVRARRPLFRVGRPRVQSFAPVRRRFPVERVPNADHLLPAKNVRKNKKNYPYVTF